MILGPDHPVTGGYPVIGVVTDEDIDKLGQVRPGQTVRLHWSHPRKPFEELAVWIIPVVVFYLRVAIPAINDPGVESGVWGARPQGVWPIRRTASNVRDTGARRW